VSNLGQDVVYSDGNELRRFFISQEIDRKCWLYRAKGFGQEISTAAYFLQSYKQRVISRYIREPEMNCNNAIINRQHGTSNNIETAYPHLCSV